MNNIRIFSASPENKIKIVCIICHQRQENILLHCSKRNYQILKISERKRQPQQINSRKYGQEVRHTDYHSN